MRVLGSTVLVFEWLILALGVPVAINTSGVAPGGAFAFLGVMTVLIAVAVARITRPLGIGLGWVVQAVCVAAGLIVPIMAILGAIFAGLYFAAVHFGRRVDALRAAASPGEQQHGPIGETVGNGASAGSDS
ncbi:MAG: DUF4233 domain-containing protein [Candidatus Nanopelagicales bacterium]